MLNAESGWSLSSTNSNSNAVVDISRLQIQSSSHPVPEHSDWLRRILAFSGIFLLAAPSALSNAMVAAVISCSSKLRNEPTYIMMAVLALMDIAHSYVALHPLGVAILLNQYIPSQQHRLVLLNIIYPAWYTTCLCYTTIAINRHMAVCWPEKCGIIFTKRNVLLWLSTWPVIVLLMMYPILSGGCCAVEFTPSIWLLRYEEGRESEENFQLMICYIASATTTAVGVCCYTGVVLKVWRSGSKMTIGPIRSGTHATDIRLAVQFTLLTFVFTFTWITLHYEASLGPERAHLLVSYFGIVGYSAMTAVNPFIYFTMNKFLRAELRNMLSSLRSSSQQPLSTNVELLAAAYQ